MLQSVDILDGPVYNASGSLELAFREAVKVDKGIRGPGADETRSRLDVRVDAPVMAPAVRHRRRRWRRGRRLVHRGGEQGRGRRGRGRHRGE